MFLYIELSGRRFRRWKAPSIPTLARFGTEAIRGALQRATLYDMPVATISRRLTLSLIESARVTSVAHQLAFSGSIVAQVTLVCASIVVISGRAAVPDASVIERPTFLAPLLQQRPRPVQEKLTFTALGGIAAPDEQEHTGETSDARSVRKLAPLDFAGGGDNLVASEAFVQDTTRAFSEVEVDSAASRDPDSEGPAYPAALVAKGIEGSVLATFVVGVDGRPDLATYIALEATDTLFGVAVREALPRMKFNPAKLNNVPVRQLVELRFTFKVVQPVDSTPKKPKKKGDGTAGLHAGRQDRPIQPSAILRISLAHTQSVRRQIPT